MLRLINFLLILLFLTFGVYLATYFRLVGIVIFAGVVILLRLYMNTSKLNDSNTWPWGRGWKYFTSAIIVSLLLGGLLTSDKKTSDDLALQIAEVAKKPSAFDSATILLNFGDDDDGFMQLGTDIGNAKRSTISARLRVSRTYYRLEGSVDKYSYMTVVSFLSCLSFVFAMSLNLYSKSSPLFAGFPNIKNDDKLSRFLNSKSVHYRKNVRILIFSVCLLLTAYLIGLFGNVITSSEYIMGVQGGKIHSALGKQFIIMYLLWDATFSI